jgi:hypothetical protein
MEEYMVPDRNGALVMPDDVTALTEAIRRLLPRAASMADAARQDAARFRTDVVAANVARALREAVAARGRGARPPDADPNAKKRR